MSYRIDKRHGPNASFVCDENGGRRSAECVFNPDSMEDVTSTSFGLVIAYLLPGFAAFFAVSFWSPPISDLFSKFLEAESNIGRFLLVIVCSLIAGLEVTIFRWIFFEKWLCRKTPCSIASVADRGRQHKDACLGSKLAAVEPGGAGPLHFGFRIAKSREQKTNVREYDHGLGGSVRRAHSIRA